MRMERIIRNPVESYFRAIARWKDRNETGRQSDYPITHGWRNLIGVTDDDREQTQRIWPLVFERLQRRGIRPGPGSFLGWNDADPALIEAIWCVVRRLNARKVVETGVANGVTSRFILEALAENRKAQLWSIDLPPLDERAEWQVGAAITERSQWSFIRGSSRRRLPRLLDEIAPIDLFIHDSDHRYYSIMFEMRLAWDALRPGGVLVVDDIDVNSAFHDFTQSVVTAQSVIAEAEPIRPDLRRFNQKGLFGLLIKPGHAPNT